jgi:hypothetical protein
MQEHATAPRPLGENEPVFPATPENSGTESPPPLRSRSYVSAKRVDHALIHRLGCRPTGERGPACSYWLTSNGIRFQVNDPIADRDSAAVVAGDGRRAMFYSYQYAASLLYHVLWLNSGSRAVHGSTGSEPERITPSAAALGAILASTEGALREARVATRQTPSAGMADRPLIDQIFIR